MIYGDRKDDPHDQDGWDTIYGDEGNDEIHGGGRADTIYGGEGKDAIYGDAGDDVIHGGDGNDVVIGGNDNDTIHGGAGDDILSGSNGNDILYGDAGDDTFLGGNGNDSINGGAGDDSLRGDAGADTFVFDMNDSFGNDTIEDFDLDQDLIEFKDVGDNPSATLEQDGDDLIITVHDDTTEAGTITLKDISSGDLTNGHISGITIDALAPTPDPDQDIRSGHGNDTVTTGSGNDTIRTQKGDDIVDAGAGDDYIVGGGGNDTLTGGEGSDIFWYGTWGPGKDIIKDFAVGEDKIQLSGYGLSYQDVMDAAVENDDGNVVLFLNNPTGQGDGYITLENVALTDLGTSDFILA